MKVLLCNKFFFLNGGIEKYLSDLLRQLPVAGHTPIPFSVRYAGSWESPYQPYFLDPPTVSGMAHFKDFKASDCNWLRLADRSIYSVEARLRLSRLLEKVDGVDVAYLLNTCNYMSPSIIHTLRRRGIPMVVHVGDYHLICPNYLLLRNSKPCTLCVRGDYYHGMAHRCVKNSLPASAVRVLGMYVQKWLRLYQLVDALVVPCRFMREQLVCGGLPRERIHLVPYPVADTARLDEPWNKENYILFFGRISHEKGIDLLVRAYQRASFPARLVIIGRSYDGERERLERLVEPEQADRIQFLGFRQGAELSRWIGRALFTVVPSRWYDNAPLSIYESMLHETPVLAANIGGIPEQVQEGVTGRLFAPDSVEALAAGLQEMLGDRERLIRMGQAGRRYVLENLSLKAHTEQLLALFGTIRENSRSNGRGGRNSAPHYHSIAGSELP